MSLVGNTPLQKNAMNHHGVKEAFFDTFFQKKATAQLSANAYTQSISENFSRFSFTGKERDEETGYGYFGARYMDHELMTGWLSVDPLADKYPSISPYAYCTWNPIKLVDPEGKEIVIVGENGERTTYKQGMSTKGLDKFSREVVEHLNDMSKTESGQEVVSKLVSSKKTYTYTNKNVEESIGRAAFVDKSCSFFMGKAESRDYAHETFHAYQYEMGMRGQTATREVGARLFEAMMCNDITSWNTHPFSCFNGGNHFSSAMMNLFLNGFNIKDYIIASLSFLNESMGGDSYKKLGYRQDIPRIFPPIRKFLNGTGQ